MSTVVVYRQDRRRRVTLVLLVLTSLVLISLDERGSGVINSTRSAAQDVVSPIQRLADDVINPAADWLDGLGRASELQDENARLRRELALARSQGAAGAIAQARLKEYSQILDLPDVADAFGVTADVLTQNVGNFSRQFTIDRGSDSGIARRHAGRRRRGRVGRPRVLGLEVERGDPAHRRPQLRRRRAAGAEGRARPDRRGLGPGRQQPPALLRRRPGGDHGGAQPRRSRGHPRRAG